MEEYFGIDLKKFGYFLGLSTSTAVAVTVLFILTFGFGGNQGVQISDIMQAAAVAPMGQSNTAGQFLCPTDGAVGLPNYGPNGTPRCPVCGQVMCFNGQSNNLNLVAGAG
ncbi:MAG: hypothetical protein HQK76_13110 [Desulfobacterales bacterium]|nr:hypothetical protein [Desulfobacterales bacterium]